MIFRKLLFTKLVLIVVMKVVHGYFKQHFHSAIHCQRCKLEFQLFRGGRTPVIGTCNHTICSSCWDDQEQVQCPQCNSRTSFMTWKANTFIMELMLRIRREEEKSQPTINNCSVCQESFSSRELFLCRECNGWEYLEARGEGQDHVKISAFKMKNSSPSKMKNDPPTNSHKDVIANCLKLARVDVMCEKCIKKAHSKHPKIPFFHLENEAVFLIDFQMHSEYHIGFLSVLEQNCAKFAEFPFTREASMPCNRLFNSTPEEYNKMATEMKSDLSFIEDALPSLIEYFEAPILVLENEFLRFGSDAHGLEEQEAFIREKRLEYLGHAWKFLQVIQRYNRVVMLAIWMDKIDFLAQYCLNQEYLYILDFQENPDERAPDEVVFDFEKKPEKNSENSFMVSLKEEKLMRDNRPAKQTETVIIDLFDIERELSSRFAVFKLDKRGYGVFVKNNKVYLIFGITVDDSEDHFRESYCGHIEEYDLNATTRQKYDLSASEAVLNGETMLNGAGCAALEYNGRVYIAGGRNRAGYLDIVNVWDLGNELVMDSHLNHPRINFVLLEIGGKMVAMGGYNGNKFVEEIEVYDQDSHKWIVHGRMEGGRSNFSASVLGRHVYISGGWNGEDKALGDIRCWSPRDKTWNCRLPALKNKRRQHSMVTIEKERKKPYILVYGGVNHNRDLIVENEKFDSSDLEMKC